MLGGGSPSAISSEAPVAVRTRVELGSQRICNCPASSTVFRAIEAALIGGGACCNSEAAAGYQTSRSTYAATHAARTNPTGSTTFSHPHERSWLCSNILGMGSWAGAGVEELAGRGPAPR